MVHIIFLIAFIFALPLLNKKYSVYIFTFITLFLFLALRYNYGNDYQSYLILYKKLHYTNDWDKELLYTFLNKLIPNYQLMLALISLFYIFVIYYLIKNNIDVMKYWQAILLLLINPYLFLIHLSSLRQTIAMCFFIIAIGFLIKKKYIGFFLSIIVAAGFHVSAILLLPIVFISDRKLTKKKKIFIIILTTLVASTSLFEEILNEILKIFPKYRMYANYNYTNSLQSTIIFCILFIIMLTNINKLEGKEIIYGKLALISIILSILAVRLTMITRFNIYFEIFIIIAYPLIISKVSNKIYRYSLFAFIVSVYLLKYISFFNNATFIDYYSSYHIIL